MISEDRFNSYPTEIKVVKIFQTYRKFSIKFNKTTFKKPPSPLMSEFLKIFLESRHSMAIFNKSTAGDPTVPLCVLDQLGRSVYPKDQLI